MPAYEPSIRVANCSQVRSSPVAFGVARPPVDAAAADSKLAEFLAVGVHFVDGVDAAELGRG